MSTVEQDVAVKVSAAIRRTLNVSEDFVIDPSHSLHNYGLSSIQLIEILVSLEEEYRFEISDSDLVLGNFDTFNKIATLVLQSIRSASVMGC
jgi:acyl carrier protein